MRNRNSWTAEIYEAKLEINARKEKWMRAEQREWWICVDENRERWKVLVLTQSYSLTRVMAGELSSMLTNASIARASCWIDGLAKRRPASILVDIFCWMRHTACTASSDDPPICTNGILRSGDGLWNASVNMWDRDSSSGVRGKRFVWLSVG